MLSFLCRLRYPVARFRRPLELLLQHRTDSISIKTQLRARMRFSASQPALVTRQWGFKRFIAPQPAGAIWALVLMHSIPTHRANLTRPAGVLPFLTTQSAATTQPTVMPHSMAIQPV